MICPLCHSSKSKKIFSSTNFHGRHQFSSQKISFHECLICHCIFPDIKTNLSFYKKYYPPKYHQKSPLLEKIWLSLNLALKKKLIPIHSTLLDIGCGTGEFIKSLPPTIETTGIDLNPLPIQNKLIIKDDFIKHRFTEKYDIITFWHSLEHFSDPQKVINKSISLLTRQGTILISLPNTNSLAYKISQNTWFHLDPPRHLFLPNDKNIKFIFPKNYQVKISYTPYEFPLDLFWSLKNKPYLRLLYPLLKILDHETMLLCVTQK